MNNRASLLNRPGVFYYQIKALENILATRDPISYVHFTAVLCSHPKKVLLIFFSKRKFCMDFMMVDSILTDVWAAKCKKRYFGIQGTFSAMFRDV